VRSEANRSKIEEFMSAVGKRVAGEGSIYLAGGATAVLHGWRPMTIDVDLKPDPEPRGFFAQIEPQLIRYPAVDPASFRDVVRKFCDENG
jgi:hypothetical protein